MTLGDDSLRRTKPVYFGSNCVDILAVQIPYLFTMAKHAGFCPWKAEPWVWDLKEIYR